MQAETNLFHGYSDAAFANNDDHCHDRDGKTLDSAVMTTRAEKYH
jgi:hypothetical protein